jgi:hypothetical protein
VVKWVWREQTTVALADAEQLAAAEKERAFDPVVSPDPREAHERMVDSSFKADRLRTLVPRLQRRLAEVAVRERSLEWLAERDAFEAERCPPLEAARADFDAALEKMLDYFRLCTEYSAARGALLSRRPDQCGMEGVSNPIPAPRMLSDTRLFDCSGAPVWPDPREINRVAVEMSNSVLAMVSSGDRDACSPFWHRAVARRQAAAAEEAELQGKRFAEMKIAQEKRENEEAAARWNAAHGTR